MSLYNSFPKQTIAVHPDGRRSVMIDYRNSQLLADRPEFLLCDFCCCEVSYLRCYPTYAFALRLRRGHPDLILDCQQASWNACGLCNPLFRAEDSAALGARVRGLSPGMYDGMPLEFLYDVLQTVRSGDPWDWRAGERNCGR